MKQQIYMFIDVQKKKAIKIGKVTRLLKQNSVDCILNVEQMKFDSEVLDTEIDLILSNNKKIKYKIGDKPFSSMCDYMEKCSYIDNKTLKKYNKILNETELDETTYSENHMLLKIEKIMKLIKNLFKLNFFYSKDDLFGELRKYNNYTDEQIYTALSRIIDDNNEIIKDKFNRDGNLINILDFYLFKPREIDVINTHDISVPIENKNNEIKVIFSNDKNEDEDANYNEYINLLKYIYLKNQITLGKEKESTKIDPKGQNYWYEYFSIIRPILIKNNFDKELIDTVVFEHSIEELVLKDKLILLNNLNVIQDLTKYFDKKLLNIMRFYIEKIKEYFNNFIIEHDNKYIFLYDDEIKDNYSLYIFNETKWQRETETILIQKLKNESFKKKFSEKYKIINKNELANIYGSLKKVKKTDDYNKFKIFFIDTGVVGATCISRTVHKSREDLQAILKN